EAEIYVPLRPHRVERELPRMRLRADRADPLRPQADLLRIEVEKLGGARERDVDVLDHRLGMQADEALHLLREAEAAVPAHDLRVGARAEPLLAVKPADERMLGEDVLRAPEPVGVPAPQVVVGGEVVLLALRDGP